MRASRDTWSQTSSAPQDPWGDDQGWEGSYLRGQENVQAIFIHSFHTYLWNICWVPGTHLTSLSLHVLTCKMRSVPQSVSQWGALLMSRVRDLFYFLSGRMSPHSPSPSPVKERSPKAPKHPLQWKIADSQGRREGQRR